MSEPLIKYQNVEVAQQDYCVLNNISFELTAGDFIYLIGKVGAGKTSLLKTMYAELNIVAGEAEVLGHNLRTMKRKHIPQLRKKLGIVFQDFQLLTDRNVYDNLKFVLRATGWKNKEEIQERIEDVLKQVGMSDKGQKYPNELSGGEQQRIVIARAILNSPAVILADEPTGNLDVETGREIVKLLQEISRAGSLVIMTTHNIQLLKEFPGKVFSFKDKNIEDVTEQFHQLNHSIIEKEKKETADIKAETKENAEDQIISRTPLEVETETKCEVDNEIETKVDTNIETEVDNEVEIENKVENQVELEDKIEEIFEIEVENKDSDIKQIQEEITDEIVDSEIKEDIKIEKLIEAVQAETLSKEKTGKE